MVPANDAEQLILDLATPVADLEMVTLAASLGRVLGRSVSSQLDFPHWDNSAMDGYAVRYDDVATVPATLTVVEEIPAGQVPQRTLQPGEAARIFTGGLLPAGADTIVMQENTRRQENQVDVLAVPAPQAFVRKQGSFYQAGAELLGPGIRIGAAEIAVLAAAQCVPVPVYRRPRVAILSTGNELVDINHPLGPGQIVDSNRYALAALIEQSGAVAVPLGIVPDQKEATRQAIAEALTQADMVISSGGVSVGDYDYVDQILAELGATIHIRSVAVKPGKPLTVATFDRGSDQGQDQLYFGLPGNPVSSLVSFWRFVQPALRKLSGLSTGWSPTFVWATTDIDLKAGGQRETYLWGHLSLGDNGYRFTLAAGGHSSGNLVNLSRTNGLAQVPLGETMMQAGSAVRVLVVGNVNS
ncbi:molybdopterin molybdotransferase MoeA [Leptolyngbya cf. ectocarpi LEGE 11479]|uniref:Molybdopterin molybdenumtransferase n=1 Tax=Leptolyngbya cf. ectocarpi LEGE 11479 TaxID=1828722 RepID=A0A929F9W1_LEPEC|nr:gephyrin-like molybdotransferase Glp [Leptolyngbya ectocarpi]MBE9069591.1 molybdopterin molybdotransferase MoeA [Leptolyngbya cf. ectocarpi LEGE 11479]